MSAHITPVFLQARFYDPGVDVDKPLCEMDAKYTGTFDVQLLDNGVARISCATGKVSIADYKEFFFKLKRDYNVVRAEWRHGKREIVKVL